jgi:hypothetical protein
MNSYLEVNALKELEKIKTFDGHKKNHFHFELENLVCVGFMANWQKN